MSLRTESTSLLQHAINLGRFGTNLIALITGSSKFIMQALLTVYKRFKHSGTNACNVTQNGCVGYTLTIEHSYYSRVSNEEEYDEISIIFCRVNNISKKTKLQTHNVVQPHLI